MEITNFLNIILTAIAVSVIGSTVFAFSSWLSKRRLDSSHSTLISLIDKNESEILEKIKESKNTQLAEAVDQKKESFLNIPNISFHFADKEEIRNFYNDYFKEPTIEQVVAEMTSELRGDVKGTLPKVLEAKIGGKDLSKWISTIKLPETSDAAMFRRYQRETIKNNQVTLGLELVEVDLSDLNAFTKLVSELDTKFGLKIDESKISSQNTDLKSKATEKTLVRLENAAGPVLIEGKFKILNQSDDYYKCVYEHPVNEYLVGVGKTITISLILKKSSLESNISGNYAQSLGQAIPLKVYGKVWQPIDRKADVWELQITPLAVY